jgi:signal transduction histidine kinase
MAALFAILLGASACLLGYFLYDFGRTNFIRETEAAIDTEIEQIMTATDGMGADVRRQYIAQKSALRPHPVYYYQDTNGTRLAGNISHIPQEMTRLTEGVLRFLLPIHGKQHQVAAKIHTFDDGARLLIARDIDDITRSYDRLTTISIIIMAFMLVVVSVSFFISVFVVGRINRIARTAQLIMDTGDLSRRIAIDSDWDDLSNLGITLNRLLARIEALMHGIREVSDNIAHDLRTPLTRLRNQLEDLKREAKPETIDGLLNEADGLLETFNALLRIANIEKSKRHQAFASIDMQAILRDVLELYEPLAEAKDIAFDVALCAVPARQGDRDLLFQAFANLLDNAIKFSPNASGVQVTLAPHENAIRCVIADSGEGLSPHDRARVFDRFYRADKSRHISGNGLGLSLVKAVIELHQGSIALEDNEPSVRVVVTL